MSLGSVSALSPLPLFKSFALSSPAFSVSTPTRRRPRGRQLVLVGLLDEAPHGLGRAGLGHLAGVGVGRDEPERPGRRRRGPGSPADEASFGLPPLAAGEGVALGLDLPGLGLGPLYGPPANETDHLAVGPLHPTAAAGALALVARCPIKLTGVNFT